METGVGQDPRYLPILFTDFAVLLPLITFSTHLIWRLYSRFQNGILWENKMLPTTLDLAEKLNSN